MSQNSTFTFPQTSLTVNRMGYGAMQLAGPHVFGPPKDPEAAVAVLRKALELGVNHIDTSDFYGPHVTNQIIKKALHPYAKNLVIVTKVGAVRGADASWNLAFKKEELISAVHDNLRNLGLEALDIVNFRLMPGSLKEGQSIAEPFSVLADLQKQGLIKHLGLSTVNAQHLKEAQQVAPVVCIQNEYNIAKRDDDAFIGDLKKQGIAYVPYFPLGGFTPLQSSTLNAIAQRLDKTPMQVALAWLYRRSENILLIPGTSSIAHLQENISATALELSPEIMSELNSIASHK